ncbi:N-formylglutamate deformylase [Caulobacter sp. BK020]|uniref:N-formylglutamate deformylase n=1 Tax=Caulobacter sp. BK020 TaxID=2512117 RepID=UPI00104DA10F|nr:N-formylglutamate deformylase [Caulobacter sp. BK020]TCS13594.1 formiminoglutamase [Caulobacter sp. BK020]
MSSTDWLHVTRGDAPLVVSIPHAGAAIPADIEARLVSPWLARKDADWWLGELYAFAEGLGATVVRTEVSRTVIDVNRDPSGVSLYPGQVTTSLCPVDTFDGEPLYRPGQEPDAAEITARRAAFFDPYHSSLQAELDRLVARHGKVVLYDAHSIRSRAPRLFDGELPQFNIGTNSGPACDPGLTRAVEAACDAAGLSRVTNGRFKGGWITRHFGRPDKGVHAVQMELACRGYIDEPTELTPDNWPTPFHPSRAASLQATLSNVMRACVAFANTA